MAKPPIKIRQVIAADSVWMKALLENHWGSTLIIARGQAYHADQLSGFVAVEGEKRIGLLTYSIKGSECEVVTLNSLEEGRGVGSALLKAAESAARAANCHRMCLITSNDNLKAAHFYQRRGFVLVAVHRNAIEISRKLKPEIPLLGIDGIPIRDELELELLL